MARTAEKAAEATALDRGYRKTRRGYVSSDKMDKTIVVEVEDRVKHPLYGKVLRRSSKVKAHDEQNTAGIGDLVVITETRPLSATKRWRLVEIAEKAK
jgi:small subunit ribosomal protein S17